jgi:hypothetical protein
MRRIAWTAALLLALVACSKSTSTAPTPGEATGAAGGSSASGSSGAAEVQGSLTTSGAYDATWTWEPGNSAEFGSLGGITLTSDKDTFANIMVANDGTFTFGSGQVSEIGLSLAGAGAQVTLDSQDLVVCSFTVDTDLTGAPGGALHLKGTMTFVGSDGVVSC